MAQRAPHAERFSAYPATWYLFGRSRELGHGPVSRRMLGRLLVAYRTASGQFVVMEGRCAHLGADLGNARIIGEALQCPYHHWEYGPDGCCIRIPSQNRIPTSARLRSYPVLERHGYVFFFNGPQPQFPLPFFDGARPEDYVAGRMFRFIFDCPWFMLVSNGFDVEHFRTVHDRTLIGPPKVDCPAPLARRMHYHARVTGKSIFDRLLRGFVGREVDVSITSWGGPFILVTGFFRRARSYILIAAQPLEDGRTKLEVIVFAERSLWPIARVFLQPLNLWIRRLFTTGFTRDDMDRIGSARYNPGGLIESDRELIEFFRWAAELPGSSPESFTDWRKVVAPAICSGNSAEKIQAGNIL
jgi:nitrite reductase/ring-hydroxylating ferredoxin subunit